MDPTSLLGTKEEKVSVPLSLPLCSWLELEEEEMFPPGLIHHRSDGPGPGEVPRSGGAPSLVLTADPKPRLRWTADLHERFVDAVAQLGGAESKIFAPPFPLSPTHFLHSWHAAL